MRRVAGKKTREWRAFLNAGYRVVWRIIYRRIAKFTSYKYAYNFEILRALLWYSSRCSLIVEFWSCNVLKFQKLIMFGISIIYVMSNQLNCSSNMTNLYISFIIWNSR